MESWELAARESVRDTIARYAHAGDRFRLRELAECFTSEGVLEIKGSHRAQGREAIVSMLGDDVGASRPARDGFFVRHFVTNIHFDAVTRHRIDTSAYFMVLTDRGPDHWGRYRDAFEPVGTDWLLAHRLAAVDTAVTDGWAAGRS
ncbi:nuclear transport factor 2 family protein [Streptomyces sp. NPDC058247]|uniref:nuclear transport factor 2 family protein n=1 Tax=Streptomyces sp. NPDC058247 TaxID=3346401 RepID=UPI0036ED6D97